MCVWQHWLAEGECEPDCMQSKWQIVKLQDEFYYTLFLMKMRPTRLRDPDRAAWTLSVYVTMFMSAEAERRHWISFFSILFQSSATTLLDSWHIQRLLHSILGLFRFTSSPPPPMTQPNDADVSGKLKLIKRRRHSNARKSARKTNEIEWKKIVHSAGSEWEWIGVYYCWLSSAGGTPSGNETSLSLHFACSFYAPLFRHLNTNAS